MSAEHLDDGVAYGVQVRAQPHQNLGGYAFTFAEEAQQQVLGADVVVSELQCFAQ
jgi:hypothetical protein